MGIVTPPAVDAEIQDAQTLESLAQQKLQEMEGQADFDGSSMQRLLLQLSDLDGKTIAVDPETSSYSITFDGNNPAIKAELESSHASSIAQHGVDGNIARMQEIYAESVSNGIMPQAVADKEIEILQEAGDDSAKYAELRFQNNDFFIENAPEGVDAQRVNDITVTTGPAGASPEGLTEIVTNGVENEQKAQELLTRLLQADATNNDPGNNQTAGAGVNNMQDMLQNMGPLGMIFGIIMAVMSGQDIGQALQQFTNPQGSSNDATATNNQPGNTAPENNEQSTTQEQPQQTAENGQDNEQSGVEQPEQTVESAPETEQTVEPPEQEVSSNDLGGVNGTAVTFQPNQEIALGDPQVDLDNGTMTLGGMSGSDAFNSLSSGDLQQFAMVDATVDQSLGMQNASFQPEAPVSNFGYLTMNA